MHKPSENSQAHHGSVHVLIGLQAVMQLMMEAGGLLEIQGPLPSTQFHSQMNRSCSCKDQTMPMALETTLTWRYSLHIVI